MAQLILECEDGTTETLECDDELLTMIRAKADATGLSERDVVIEVLDRLFDRHRKLDAVENVVDILSYRRRI